MLFNLTEIPEMSESDAINSFTCQIMSGLPWILSQLVKPQIKFYSTWLTFQTMSKPFQVFFKSEKVGIRYIHSLYMLNNVWITLNIFQLVQPQIGCHSTWLTFQTMSEPFQIIFKSSTVWIRCNKLFYMPNNVWIALNIISISKTPRRMLFNLTDIPNNVRTIPNFFWIWKYQNRIYTLTLYAK